MANRPETDETYFARDYQGFYMEDGSISINNDREYIYTCKVCFAMTTKPKEHENWHRNVLWQPVPLVFQQPNT